MIVPSIDLMNGNAVQLIGGKEFELDAGDPRPLAETFRIVGDTAVIDLDAALGKGSNRGVIEELVRMAPCRVGGGIRDAQAAIDWLDRGAKQVILGTAAVPEVLQQLPPERVIAALDAVNDEVVVEGWQTRTGRTILDRMKELNGLVGGYLVTFVEREGRMGGIDLERVKALVQAAGGAKVTVAGGVTTPEEIAAIDKLGADAQVGMALYTGKMDLTEAMLAPMTSDRPDGLWPTVIVDEGGVALGLAYSDMESVKEAMRLKKGVYHSRSRGLWIKGETSGTPQDLLAIDLDCDRDTLRFTVRQHGSGFCHLNTRTCWGEDRGLSHLIRRLTARLEEAPKGSYTRRLLDDPDLLKSKLLEEAQELNNAGTIEEVIWETADLLYFGLVAMIKGGATMEEVEAELDRRAKKVTRRPGNAKTS